jgi:hypothetical protein
MKQPPGRLTPPLESAALSRRRCLQRGAETGLLHLLGGLGSVGTVALIADTAHAGG